MERYANGNWSEDTNFPKYGEESIKRMLVEARRQYGLNGAKEVALIFITKPGTDKYEWDFATNYGDYGVATQQESSTLFNNIPYNAVNITSVLNDLVDEADKNGNTNYFLAEFHNHGNNTAFCFIDLKTFFADDRVVTTLLDTSKYVYGLRKLPEFENVLTSAEELLAKLIKITQLGEDELAIALAKEEKLYAEGKLDDETYKIRQQDARDEWFALIWDIIFSVIQNETKPVLERFRMKKPSA